MRHLRALSVGSLADYQKLNELHFSKSPDRPIHVPTQSLFTTTSGFNNFRGLLNWGAFLLVITTSRMALENLLKYGLIMNPYAWVRVVEKPCDLYLFSALLLCSNLFILFAYFLERASISGYLTNSLHLRLLKLCNLIILLVFPTAVILSCDINPLFSCPLLAIYTVLFLKLWSYGDVNRWCRDAYLNIEPPGSRALNQEFAPALLRRQRRIPQERPLSSNVEHLEPQLVSMDADSDASISKDRERESLSPDRSGDEAVLRRRHVDSEVEEQPEKIPPTEHRDLDWTARNISSRMSVPGPEGLRGRGTSEEEYQTMLDAIDLEPQKLIPMLECHEIALMGYRTYPHNVTLSDMYYFIAAPTLCYELNFPRTMSIRKPFLIKRTLEAVFLTFLIIGLTQQWMVTTLKNSVNPISSLAFSQIVERCLKLAIPNHLIWLLGFYALFHSMLNVVAEVLCFADRFFYSDWWNAESVPAFWSKWNIPVHRFARRHIYIPLLKRGWTRPRAGTMVFFISALLHEFLVSVPLKMPRMWAFLGMLSQMPYAILLHKLFPSGGAFGNLGVWLTLILGQPMAMLFYFHDYYVTHMS